MMRELAVRTRSTRRFRQSERVGLGTLRSLIDIGRITASGANLQPLRYALVTGEGACAEVFPSLKWAGYLTDWGGPGEGERPPAYIVMLSDGPLKPHSSYDPGIAAQTIALAAAEMGLACCMLGAIDRDGIRSALGIPARFEIMLVIAVGRPAESIVLEPVGEDGDIRYWRDGAGVHHVPKRALDDVIVLEVG